MLLPMAATVVETVAGLRGDRGPLLQRYALVLELGPSGLFKFVIGSAATDDGRTVIVPLGGGTGGAWVRVRGNDRGADLTDAPATLQVGDGAWRVLPAATLTASRSQTLGTTNAANADRIMITRLDVGAFTVPILNGGAAGGTLATLPVSAKSFCEAAFDGTNWSVRSSGLLL